MTAPEAANEGVNDSTVAARAGVPAPESKSQALGAVMPPRGEVKLPVPPVNNVAPEAPAANDALGGIADRIEHLLAPFIADRLPKAMHAGLQLKVVIDKSNAITGEQGVGQHDISISFIGGKLEDEEHAQELAAQLRAAMREHPAFEGMTFGGADTPIEHLMRCQILGLEADRYATLLKPQPRVQTTFIADAAQPETAPAAGHCTGGADCGHCNAPKTPKATTAASAAPAETTTATTAPSEQPSTAQVANIHPVAPPVTTVEAPAASHTKSVVANDAQMQRAG